MNARAILVVGGTGGLGGEVVRSLLKGGFAVHFTGRRAEAVAHLESAAPGSRGHAVDACDAQAMKSLVASIDAESGLAGYVHLAGGWAGGRAIDAAGAAGDEWGAMFRMNWESLRVGGTTAFAILKKRGRGSMVTIGSLAGLHGTVNAAAYAVSKSAVIGFTRCLAEEGKSCGVRANCIVPGIIDTPGNRAAMPDARRDDWVSPESIAAAVLYLCSEASLGVNGSTILMKGGL